MRQTVTETIPAVPEKTEQVVRVTCDVCGKPSRGVCDICGRDVCKEHWNYEPGASGDYPDRWCSVCLRLWRDKYAAQIRTIEERRDGELAAVWSALKAESKAEVPHE